MQRGLQYRMIALLGLAGFFILTFFLSIIVYIYLRQFVQQGNIVEQMGWIRLYAFPGIGLLLCCIVAYAILSHKKMSKRHIPLSAGLTFLLYYADYYFGSFLNRKYANLLYSIFEKPSMEMVLMGYMVLTLLIGLLFYYFSYKMPIKESDQLIENRSDLLDDTF